MMSHCNDLWEDSLGRLFELTILLSKDASEGLAREGLTASRAHLLIVVAERGPSSQRDLAEWIGVTPRTITALVDGLESTGFVTREPDPRDRRTRHVTMTEQGKATSRRLLDGRRRFAESLFSDLSPETFEGFDAGVRQVLEKLRRLLDAAHEKT
jgi:DNA-binding MarR family transcriptional regulator